MLWSPGATTREKPVCRDTEPTCRNRDATQLKINKYLEKILGGGIKMAEQKDVEITLSHTQKILMNTKPMFQTCLHWPGPWLAQSGGSLLADGDGVVLAAGAVAANSTHSCPRASC